MKRIEKICADKDYLEYMHKNALAEKDRIFCCHGYAHCLDVARLAYILYLRREENDDRLAAMESDNVRELLYASALLHDIGRHIEYLDKSKDHALESALLAKPILIRAGFEENEISLVLSAIEKHRFGGGSAFDKLIYRGDKESRPCIFCEARSLCKNFAPDDKVSITL